MADPTDVEREALIVALAEEALEWSDACTKACEAGAASAYQAERWSCAKRGVRAGLDAAGYRSPASLLRAWEMGRDAAAKVIKRRWEGYAGEHGFCDPTTGITEYPGNGDEWVGDMQELEDAIRALTPPPDLMQRAGDGDAEIAALQAEVGRLREALTAMVKHDVSYMTINQLGDPERQLRIIRARRALAGSQEGDRDGG